jgi:vacuolar protein sorting-associated protein 26|mmetsp:Transcript_12631/g.47222  ORF Transcript_12631/g.47222 Transcript_12631/m.47222 type:complete len:298 (+) Transcript_12631:227-1120(+)
MSFFGLGRAVTIDLTHANGDTQRTASVKSDRGASEVLPVFTTNETIGGTVHLSPAPGKKIDHLGVKIEVLGQTELYFDRQDGHDFVSLVAELLNPGELQGPLSVPFEFKNVVLPHESYRGINVRVRYFIRVTITRSYGGTVTQDFPFVCRLLSVPPEINTGIKMEVGIEDCLHIEFEYAKGKYHLRDVVVGKIFFLLVRIKIKHMEVEIRRRESAGGGSNTYNESETLAKYEVMDGAPVRGESVPVRLFLTPYDITPTYKNVANRFSVKYYLNLVLVDEEDRRYFKQQEITMFRHEL